MSTIDNTTPKFSSKLDMQHPNRMFHITVACASNPTIRAYLYEGGQQWVPPSNWTCVLGYGENEEYSTSLVIIDGVIANADSSSSSQTDEEDKNYVDFPCTEADIGQIGDYFCEIRFTDPVTSYIYTFGPGMLHVKASPISGTYTTLVLTETVNWSLINNTGLVPWSISNETVVITSCDQSPYTVAIEDSAKTFIIPSSIACDFRFILPLVDSSDTIGRHFGFLREDSTYIITLQTQEGNSIDDSGDAGTKYSIRNYGIPNSVMIKQVTANQYMTVWGDGAWSTGGPTYYSSSSSSSSSEEYSSSSSSSSSDNYSSSSS